MSHMTELHCSSMGGMLDADYFRMFSSCPENGFVRQWMRCRPTTGGSTETAPVPEGSGAAIWCRRGWRAGTVA